MEKKKLRIILIAVITLIVVLGIVGIVIWNNTKSKTTDNAIAEDENEKIVHQDDSYIQYKFDFTNVANETKEYNIKDYKLVFNIVSEGIPSFQFGDNEKIETLAREYDVYYLINQNAVIIANYTEFNTGMYFGDSEGIHDLSDVVKGVYTFKNFAVKDNILTFDAEKYSKDDYRVTLDNSIFSVNLDDYTQYVESDYPIEVTYKYDLSNKDFTYEQFEITPIKTIQELYEEINNKYDEVTTAYDETTIEDTDDTTGDETQETVE